MSERTHKVASTLHHIAAISLNEELGDLAGLVTVTSVDVAGDIKTATIWVGILADDEARRQEVFQSVEETRSEVQKAVAAKMSSKFTPRVEFKLDQSGPYAERINSLLRDL